MKEQDMYRLWFLNLWKHKSLKGCNGEEIQIIQPGTRNTSAGPDFSNSKLVINGITWFGNVEMHTFAYEWYSHNHEIDPAYNNVVLHVVWENVGPPAITQSKRQLITLELKPLVLDVQNRIQSILPPMLSTPCLDQQITIDPIYFDMQLMRSLTNRLEKKVSQLAALHKLNNGDWEQTCLEWLARGFGLPYNGDPMQQLIKTIGWRTLYKERTQIQNIEALLLGSAGFFETLTEIENPFWSDLIRKFRHLQDKWKLKPMEKSIWKNFGTRPDLFPGPKISELAQLIFRNDRISSLLTQSKPAEIIQRLEDIGPSAFWINHYTPEKQSTSKFKRVGKDFITRIIINTWAPLIYFQSILQNDPTLKHSTIEYLESLPFENNRITKKWQRIWGKEAHAGHSQGILEQEQNWCSQKLCWTCAIGQAALKRNS